MTLECETGMLRSKRSGFTGKFGKTPCARFPREIVPLATILAILALSQSPVFAQVTIAPNFSPNPLELRGNSGGSVPVNDIVGRADTPNGPCTGFANTKPDHTLVLTAFFDSLSLQIQSGEDTALAIQGPGGVWCNDDNQGKNPGISGQWLAGTYRVWVSSYGKNRPAPYVLRITEKR
jgi:hypothetical protein